MAPIEYVESVLMEDWSEHYAFSEHCNKYWNAVSAPSDDEWPEGLTEDGDKLFLHDKVWCRNTGSRRSLSNGATPNLCIRAATRCNEILNGGLSSLLDTTQS